MAKDFLYPVAFGILLSYLLYPIVNYIEKRGLPRIIAILSGIAILVFVFSFLAVFILKRLNLFMYDLPGFRDRTVTHVENLQFYIESTFNIPAERLKDFILRQIFDISIRSGEIFSATTGTLFAIFIQPVYIFLFLYYRTKFAYFILKIVGAKHRMIAVNILREVAVVVTRYMLGVATVVFTLCVINSTGYWIIGIEYPLLLGVIASLFSFIPYFGTLLGGSLTFLFVLLTQNSPILALHIGIFAIAVNFIDNNFLTPNIVGYNIRINPFIIILALILGAMIWGVPGMLVVIPFLAIMNVVMKRIPSLRSYVYLLGPKGTKQHTLSIENIRKFYVEMRKRIKRFNPFSDKTKNQSV